MRREVKIGVCWEWKGQAEDRDEENGKEEKMCSWIPRRQNVKRMNRKREGEIRIFL